MTLLGVLHHQLLAAALSLMGNIGLLDGLAGLGLRSQVDLMDLEAGMQVFLDGPLQFGQRLGSGPAGGEGRLRREFRKLLAEVGETLRDAGGEGLNLGGLGPRLDPLGILASESLDGLKTIELDIHDDLPPMLSSSTDLAGD